MMYLGNQPVGINQTHGLNVITGTVTLSADQSAGIVIDVPFEPKIFMINLREMPSDNTQYKTYFEVGAFYANTTNVPNAVSTSGGMLYQHDGYSGASRTTLLVLPTYSNGQLTLMPRMTWTKGTYDYIVAG